ncbi:MAG: efflux RND transporter periplasmic adaptor subunit [Clostridia bacterium]|nr:efflux RND transporter periplasmic adaptor subunit [Clostridia bacterium]
MKKTVVVIALLGAVLGVSWGGYAYREQRTTERLQFLYPEISPIQDTVQLQGTVIATEKQRLYARGTSRVLELYVAEGDVVKAGQCLLKLERVESVAEEQAAAAVAFTRLQESVMAGDLNGATELLESMDIQTNGMIGDDKTYCLYSEKDALVMSIDAAEGETLSALLPCITLYTPESLRVEAMAGETVVGMLAASMDCYISVPAFSIRELQGEIISVAPFATEKTSITGQSTCETAVLMRTSDPTVLRPGYRAAAKVVVAARESALLLPYEAIAQDETGQEYVLKLQGLRVVRQNVQTGSELEEWVEVCEGLLAQDAVMLRPDLRWEGALVNFASH